MAMGPWGLGPAGRINSLVTFGLVAELEENAIERILQVEMENFRTRKAHNPLALPPLTSVLSGDFLPVEKFPLVIPVKPGKDRIESFLKDSQEYSVLITHIDEKPRTRRSPGADNQSIPGKNGNRDRVAVFHLSGRMCGDGKAQIGCLRRYFLCAVKFFTVSSSGWGHA